MSQEIIVEVAVGGATTITTKGFKGKSCKEATKQMEKALGVVAKDTPTKEAYETESVAARNRA